MTAKSDSEVIESWFADQQTNQIGHMKQENDRDEQQEIRQSTGLAELFKSNCPRKVESTAKWIIRGSQ